MRAALRLGGPRAAAGFDAGAISALCGYLHRIPKPREPAVIPLPAEPDVPYRIETTRLVIRCYNPADAWLMKAAIDESAEHLRRWMWRWFKDEPESLDEKIERIRLFRSKFDQRLDYGFGIFSRDEKQLLGGTGFHPRVGARALEIGYWVHAGQVQRGICSESTAALTRVAFEWLRLARLEIRCDPENTPSAAVPRKLGYRHDATLRRCIFSQSDELRDSMVWTMLAGEYPGSPAARIAQAADVKAFDAAGRLLELAPAVVPPGGAAAEK